jgi:Sodium:sulfate symporter transmembrane region/lactate/malate dehydrogenase, NAD binding domain
MLKQPKIAIVGAGLVGGAAALFASYAIPGVSIVLIDLDPVRAEGQVLDLVHATAVRRAADFRAGGYADAKDADIVVITAGAGVKPGQTRLDLVQINARIIRDIVDQTAKYAPEAIYVVATNPCDVLAHVIYEHLGLPRERVISTGSRRHCGRVRIIPDVAISWASWALAASVPGLLCLIVIPFVLMWLAPPEVVETPDAPALATRELDAMGPMSSTEWTMAAVFVGLLFLWVFGDQFKVSATLAAAIGVSVMFVTRVLTWQDALDEKPAWDTMIWIGLLIMLAAKLNEYGMVQWFGKEFGAHLEGRRLLVVYILVATVHFYAHYFFASATAHISALFPLSLALLIAAGVPAFASAIALGALSNVFGCLTQYAIGSGPVMFGAGYVTQGEWWRIGFIMSVIYLVIWLIIGPLWWMVLGHAKTDWASSGRVAPASADSI